MSRSESLIFVVYLEDEDTLCFNMLRQQKHFNQCTGQAKPYAMGWVCLFVFLDIVVFRLLFLRYGNHFSKLLIPQALPKL